MADVRGDVGTLLGLGGSEPWGNAQVMTRKITDAFSSKFGRSPSNAEINDLMAGNIVTLKNVSQPANSSPAASTGHPTPAASPAAKPVANPSGAPAYQQAMQQQQVAPSVGGQPAGKPVALPVQPVSGFAGQPASPPASPVQGLVDRLNRGESLSSEELGRVLAYGQSLQNPKQKEDEKNVLKSFGGTGVPDVDTGKIKTDLRGINTGLGTNVGGAGSNIPPQPIQPPKRGTYGAPPPSTENPNWRANYTAGNRAPGPQITGATRVAGPAPSTWNPNQGLPASSSPPAAQGAPTGHPGAQQQSGPAGQYQPRNFAPVVPQNQQMNPAQQYQLTQLQLQQGKAYAAPDNSQYQAKPGSYDQVTIKQAPNVAQQYQLAQLQRQQSQPVSIARGRQYDPTKTDQQWATQTNQNMQGVPLASAPKTNWAAPSSYYNAAMGNAPPQTSAPAPPTGHPTPVNNTGYAPTGASSAQAYQGAMQQAQNRPVQQAYQPQQQPAAQVTQARSATGPVIANPTYNRTPPAPAAPTGWPQAQSAVPTGHPVSPAPAAPTGHPAIQPPRQAATPTGWPQAPPMAAAPTGWGTPAPNRTPIAPTAPTGHPTAVAAPSPATGHPATAAPTGWRQPQAAAPTGWQRAPSQLTPAQAYQLAMQQRTMIQGNPPPMNTAYPRGM